MCSKMWCTPSTGKTMFISCSQQMFFQHALTTCHMTVKQSHQLWLLGDRMGVDELKEFADEVSTLILKNPRSVMALQFWSRASSWSSIISIINHQSSFIIHHSSFIIHHSSFIIHQTSNIKHQTSNIKHQTSFIIHHSSFIICLVCNK